MATNPKCCAEVRCDTSTLRYRPCSNSGVVDREGKHYCRTHDPERIAARRATAAEAMADKVRKAREAGRLARSAPALLHYLEAILNALPERRDWLDPADEKAARDAVRFAKGES